MDNVAIAGGEEPKYTHDVYTDTRKFRLGGEFGGKARLEWVEYMGHLSCYGDFARMSVSHGNHI